MKQPPGTALFVGGEEARIPLVPDRAAVGGDFGPALRAQAVGQMRDQLAVYERTLVHGEVTVLQVAADLGLPAARVARAMTDLTSLRLVTYRGADNRYQAVGPDAAPAELIALLKDAVDGTSRELAGMQQQLKSFIGIFSGTGRNRPRCTTVRPPQTELRLADAVRTCTSEILAMEPADCRVGDISRTLWLAQVPPGVPIRVLIPGTVRTHPAGWGALREAISRGARIRTYDGVSEYMVIVGDVAFIPDRTEEGRSQVTAVHEPAVISLLRRIHEYAWQAGTDFAPDGRTDAAIVDQAGIGADVDPDGCPERDTLDEVKGTILGLLASGLKDDVVARRVGMSSRTFRRHMSRLMSQLDAQSRFQAGVAAARAGLVGPGATAESAAGTS